MTRFALAILVAAALSLLVFPWPIAALLALICAPFIPAGPLALGLMADALYLGPGFHALPLASIAGVLASAFALFVQRRLAPGIIA